MPEEPVPTLMPDEMDIWRRAFVAQIKALAPITVAYDYAQSALEAYQSIRAASYMEADYIEAVGSCDCEVCREQGKKGKVN